MKRLKHPRCCRRGKCALVGAVTAFVPPNTHLRRGFLRALQIHWEMEIQPLWHHHQQQGQNHCVPSSSSAAGSGNKTQHKQQLMGKRPPEFSSQRKGSHSLPQSCTAPTVLTQKEPKTTQDTADSTKDHLHGMVLLQQSSPAFP